MFSVLLFIVINEGMSICTEKMGHVGIIPFIVYTIRRSDNLSDKFGQNYTNIFISKFTLLRHYDIYASILNCQIKHSSINMISIRNSYYNIDVIR